MNKYITGYVESSITDLKTVNLEDNEIYIVNDFPDNSITNAQMEAAINDASTTLLYDIDNAYICSDDGVYKKDHFYRFKGDSWEEIVPFSLKDIPNYVSSLDIDLSKSPNLNGVISIKLLPCTFIYVNWGDNSGQYYIGNSIDMVEHTYTDVNFNGKIKFYGDFQGVNMNDSPMSSKAFVVGFDYDSNITEIPDYAFYGTRLKKIILKEGVTKAGTLAFAGTGANYIYLPPSFKSLGEECFARGLGSDGYLLIESDADLQHPGIGSWVSFFTANSDVRATVILRNTTILPQACFQFQFERLDLPDTVTKIEGLAFSDNELIQEFTVPKNVTQVSNAFIGHDNLNLATLIFKPVTPPSVYLEYQDTGFTWSKVKQVFVPAASLPLYKTAKYYKDFSNIIYAIEREYKETGSISLENIIYDNGVKSYIFKGTFYGATSDSKNNISWEYINTADNQFDIECIEQGDTFLRFKVNCDFNGDEIIPDKILLNVTSKLIGGNYDQ